MVGRYVRAAKFFRVGALGLSGLSPGRWGAILERTCDGSQQGHPARSKSANRFIQGIRWLIWLGRLCITLLWLLLSLWLSPLLLIALVVLLGVWLLPIPSVREALLKLQLWIASTLGDSYVLVSRPIEAASILGQVRRDTSWLVQTMQDSRYSGSQPRRSSSPPCATGEGAPRRSPSFYVWLRSQEIEDCGICSRGTLMCA